MRRLATYFARVAPIVAVTFALAGLALLRGHAWVAGAALVTIGMGILIADMRGLDTYGAGLELPRPRASVVVQAASWATVLGLDALAIAGVIGGTRGLSDDRPAALAWILSMLVGLLTVWGTGRRPGGLHRAMGWARAHALELTCLSAVLLVALVLRTMSLPTHPYPWSGDEISVAREASRIVSGQTTRLFQTGWSDQPILSFVPTAMVQSVLGDGIGATRLTSALIGVLAVLAVYLAARELFDGATAVLSAAFLATLPYHVHFSRLGFQNILDSFMSSTMVWLAVRAARSGDRRYYYTAGAVAGLTLYSYPGTRLALGLGGVALLYCRYKERGSEHRRWHLLVFVAAAIVSAAPQAVYFALHPARFLSRLGQESILLNGWLMDKAGHAVLGAVPPLLTQLTGTVLPFVATPASGNVFNSPYPYLTLPESLLFLAGMATALARIWAPPHFILLVWFWAVLVLGGVLTMSPPASTRLLATTPVVAMFMATGGRTLFEQVRKRGVLAARSFVPICLVGVAAIGYLNIRFYWFEYRQRMYFQDAHAEYAMEVGLLARTLGEDCHLYVLGAPRVFASFPTLRYLVPQHAVADLAASDVPHIERADGECAAFFAIPENRPVLAELRRRFPGGAGGVLHRKPRPAEILFEYYVVPR
jgi:4-amino-4-deoxy-L-arabinose transferase-like glycosyltransferase